MSSGLLYYVQVETPLALTVARAKLKNEARGERTITEEALLLLRENYFYSTRRSGGDDNRLQDLFMAHTKARRLLNVYPYTVIIDSTYKTNEYGIPLYQFIGYTCTGKNFNIAFCFMSRGDTDTYRWALEQLLTYIFREKRPNAIVTDGELKLITALRAVLPANVRHMLCKVHVLRKCEEAAFKKSNNLDVAKRFHSACYELFESRTTDTFNARIKGMRAEWGHIEGLMSYLEETWLRDYKENIVRAWTDSIMHFGTSIKNRVEPVNVLKNTLHSSIGDFTQVLKALDLVTEDQMNEVKITMSQAYNTWPTDSQGLWMFDQVRNIVSKECFNLLFEIYKKMETDPPSEPCRDRYWKDVYGLPCTHEMQAYRDAQTPIEPSQIHVFWKLLDSGILSAINDGKRPANTQLVPPDPKKRAQSGGPRTKHPCQTNPLPWEHDRAQAQAQTGRERNSGMMQGRGRGRGQGTGSNVNLRQAEIGVDTQGVGRGHGRGRGRGRGRFGLDTEARVEHDTNVAGVEETDSSPAVPSTLPKADITHLGFNWGTDNIDEFMITFIRAVTNVTGDGHCGYRSFACLLNLGQEAWPQVRRQLLVELQLHADRYHYYPELEELIMRVNYYRACHDSTYWMEIPIMGEVFATLHQRPLVILSQSMPMLCLPLYASNGPSLPPYHEVDGIALVGQSNHFVPIWLLSGSPLPPIYTTWMKYHHPSVNGWDEQFESRIARYRSYRLRDGGHPLTY